MTQERTEAGPAGAPVAFVRVRPYNPQLGHKLRTVLKRPDPNRSTVVKFIEMHGWYEVRDPELVKVLRDTTQMNLTVAQTEARRRQVVPAFDVAMSVDEALAIERKLPCRRLKGMIPGYPGSPRQPGRQTISVQAMRNEAAMRGGDNASMVASADPEVGRLRAELRASEERASQLEAMLAETNARAERTEAMVAKLVESADAAKILAESAADAVEAPVAEAAPATTKSRPGKKSRKDDKKADKKATGKDDK